jgi:anti-anti-sigma regulatory factor
VTDITEARIQNRKWMLRITRIANGKVVFKLSGQMSAENVGELETLFRAEASGRRILLDLKDLTLVDQDIVSFLKRSEANGIKLENCPAYIRQWIKQQKG